jgi:hypothetical protein
MNGSTCCAGTGPVQKISGFLPFVLLGVDVERLALDHGRALDGLSGGAVDAAEDDVDVIALDQLRGLRRRDGVIGRAVLEVELEVAAEQAALGVDVADDHSRHVGVGEPDHGERARLVGDHSHLDGIVGRGQWCRHDVLLRLSVPVVRSDNGDASCEDRARS